MRKIAVGDIGEFWYGDYAVRENRVLAARIAADIAGVAA